MKSTPWCRDLQIRDPEDQELAHDERVDTIDRRRVNAQAVQVGCVGVHRRRHRKHGAVLHLDVERKVAGIRGKGESTRTIAIIEAGIEPTIEIEVVAKAGFYQRLADKLCDAAAHRYPGSGGGIYHTQPQVSRPGVGLQQPRLDAWRCPSRNVP